MMYCPLPFFWQPARVTFTGAPPWAAFPATVSLAWAHRGEAVTVTVSSVVATV